MQRPWDVGADTTPTWLRSLKVVLLIFGSRPVYVYHGHVCARNVTEQGLQVQVGSSTYAVQGSWAELVSGLLCQLVRTRIQGAISPLRSAGITEAANAGLHRLANVEQSFAPLLGLGSENSWPDTVVSLIIMFLASACFLPRGAGRRII